MPGGFQSPLNDWRLNRPDLERLPNPDDFHESRFLGRSKILAILKDTHLVSVIPKAKSCDIYIFSQLF